MELIARRRWQLRNPTGDDGLRRRGVDTRLRDVEGRWWPASEGVGLHEKRRGEVGAPTTHFGPSRENNGRGSRLGASHGGERKGGGLAACVLKRGGTSGRQCAETTETGVDNLIRIQNLKWVQINSNSSEL
jgi:hypothetical protein